MAIAERSLAARFNRPGFPVVDHRTWVIAGDGDLMEGVASEAASLAGHLGLGRLTVLYDDNRITIEAAPTSRSARMWRRASELTDGGLSPWRTATTSRPWPRPWGKQALTRPAPAHSRAHPHRLRKPRPPRHGRRPRLAPGAGGDRAGQGHLGWPETAEFHVPAEAREPFTAAARRGARPGGPGTTCSRPIGRLPRRGRRVGPALGGEAPRRVAGALPIFAPDPKGLATREASGKCSTPWRAPCRSSWRLGRPRPEHQDPRERRRRLLAGQPRRAKPPLRRPGARHGRGDERHGEPRRLPPYGSTFFVFSDYMRPGIRLAALMACR